ncbi:hypothetical protein DVJ77_15820 [Dyella tabacisoli]|uniref:Uncharacterized protein n=1 Tax=Dyella tabacisoli TaxID=2282381 RepID=A0A369UJT9_9GAMM|nr:hypothetical protein DVJ77_15820 [Dyella tabacisoli]
MRNLDQLAVPAKLKGDGIYIEGWRENASQQHTSAVAIYPDGRIYAAYYDVENGAIRYFSSDQSPGIHPAIELWIRRLAPTVETIVWPGAQSGATALPKTKIATQQNSSDPSPDEQAALLTVATSIWSASLANNWTMNAVVGDLLSDATGEILKCSAAFNLVPRPVGFMPGRLYLAANARAVVRYIAGVNQNRIYRTCISAVALHYRSSIEIASADI